MVTTGVVSLLLGALLLGFGYAGAQTADWSVQANYPALVTSLGSIACSSSSNCVMAAETDAGDAVLVTNDGGGTWAACVSSRRLWRPQPDRVSNVIRLLGYR